MSSNGVKRIVSGGQTGVDRAALDTAQTLGIECGGWCPAGRRAEDGRVPDRYPLTETPDRHYEVRTEWNVRDSDGTLVLSIGRPRAESGTAFTIQVARRLGKPCMAAELADASLLLLEAIRAWMRTHHIRVLNVAGPRESQSPGISEIAADFLRTILADGQDGQE